MTDLTNEPYDGDIQSAIDAGIALAKPEKIDAPEAPHTVIVPAGGKVEVLDLEWFGAAPRRKAGRYKLATVEAFNAYVDHHADEETTVWVHPVDGTIVAVLNDHGHGRVDTAWRDHTATLELRHTDEWAHWLSRDGRLGGQEEFAEHVEDGLTEIAEPSGAELLEIAQTFHATTNAQFRQATRLQDGATQFRYDEDVQATAGTSGELTVPAEITLVLAPYVGEEAVTLKARLRYRVKSGNLLIGYKLDRPERVIREALEGIYGRISDKFGDRAYLGAPPA